MFFTFLIRSDLPFLDILNLRLSEITEKGFIQYWLMHSTLKDMEKYEVKYKTEQGISRRLPMPVFKVPFMIWAAGLAISFVIFVIEALYYRHVAKKKR